MKSARFFSLLFAIALQAMPMCRVVTSQFLPAASSGAAIVMRWVIGGVALLGAFHAVSGASTVITSPTSATGTNGVPFSYRITTGPQAANQFNAAPLPPGLSVSTTTGRISGTPSATGVWNVTLTASDNGSAARTVTENLALTIVPGTAAPPTITTQPQSQTINAGANASFSVVASGAAPLRYQWRQGGTALSGRTTSALALTAVTTNQAGSYTVVVTNSAGSVTSSPAILTVIPLVAPTITTQPQSQTVLAGANIALSVTASGTAPLNYQWRLGGVNLAGRTASVLQLNGVTTGQAGSYSVVVSNSAGTATSATAVLTVNQSPVITSQPQSQMILNGGNASFSVVASGTPAVSYQWRFAGTDLSGQTSSTLQVNAVTTNEQGDYTVVVTNLVGAVTSAPALLTVNLAVIPPGITVPPQNQAVAAGASVSFSVVASGTSPLTYQWRLGSANLTGQTSASLLLSSVTTNQAGAYSVVVANAAGSVTSAPATLTVTVAAAPVITTQPLSQTVLAGADVSFSVLAAGAGPLSYQWRLGGVNFAGQTGTSLQLLSVTAAHAGTYSVVVANGGGAVTSAPAVLALYQSPTITTQPLGQTAKVGDQVSLSVTAVGTAPLGYQWRRNGADLAAGTGSTLAIAAVTHSQAGDYDVVVQNPAGSVTSLVARLEVLRGKSGKGDTWKDFAGHYNGLLYDPIEVVRGSSGFFSFNLTARGTYSASIQLSGGWRLSARGSLAEDGTGHNTIPRGGSSTISVDWNLDLGDSGQITGNIVAGDNLWSAQLSGDRAVFSSRTNPCPFAGKYTLNLPGDPDSTNSPAGDSYGSVTVDSNGNVVLKGVLADKTVMAQKVPVSKDGAWPLFVPLYSKTGALLAWIQFEDREQDDFHGLLSWIKPAFPSAKYFPNGFSVGADVVGSRYDPAMATAQLLNLTNGVAVFQGGNLPQPYTNSIRVLSASEVAGSDPRELKAIFKPATGLFKGAFRPAGASRPITFGGALIQKGNYAAGCFLGTDQSGLVLLEDQSAAQ